MIKVKKMLKEFLIYETSVKFEKPLNINDDKRIKHKFIPLPPN